MTGQTSFKYRKSSTLVIASADALARNRRHADFKCDGSDDDEKINEAIADIASRGGTIQLSEGPFAVGGSIRFSAAQNNIWLRGMGQGATTINGILGDGVSHIHLDTPAQGQILRNLTISDLTIDAAGRGSNASQGGGIIMQDGPGQLIDCTFRNLIIKGAANAQRVHGISFHVLSATARDTNLRISIHDCTILNETDATAWYGILIQHTTSGFSIRHNHIRAVSAVSQAVYNMIAVYGGSDTGTVESNDCRVTGEGHSVYAISAGSQIRLASNYAEMTIGVVGDEVTTFSEGGFELESTTGHSSTPLEQTADIELVNNVAKITGGPGFLIRSIGGADAPEHIHLSCNSSIDCEVGVLASQGDSLTLLDHATPGCVTPFDIDPSVTFDGCDIYGQLRVTGGTAPAVPVANTVVIADGAVHIASGKGVRAANHIGTSYREILRRTDALDPVPNSVALAATSADAVRIDTGNRVGVGPHNVPHLIDGIGGSIVLYNGTPTTGQTSVTIRAGEGQSTNPMLTVEKLDGTNIIIVDNNGITGTRFGLDANNYWTQDAGRLSAFANGTQAMLFSDTNALVVYRNWTIFSGSDVRLIMGGYDAAYPAIKRSGATAQIRKGDDSAFADLLAAKITADSGVSVGAVTFEVLNALPANTGDGIQRITNRANKLAYPDGTNWRFVGDDAIIS